MAKGKLKKNYQKIKERKKESIQDLAEKFPKSPLIILTDYRGEVNKPGLTVKEITALRRRLKTTAAEYQVVKNTLLAMTLKKQGIKFKDDAIQGPTALVLSGKEPVASLKCLLGYIKDMNKEKKVELPCIKGGIFEKKFISTAQIKRLSELPDRNTLLAQTLATMQAPTQNFVGTLNAIPQSFVRLLSALKERKEQA